MEITKGIEAIDLALFIPASRALIIADVHIGFEEALNKQGLLVPRFQFKEIVERLNKIFEKVRNIETIIVNGDLKHEFGTISTQEWRETLKIIDLLSKHCKKLILLKGNHDTILGPIAGKRNVEFADYYKTNDIYITHGHKIPNDLDFASSKILIIGHEHAAVSLKEGNRVELFKCYLKGKWKNKLLIVMPSFNLVTEGTNILREELLSPFLKNIADFEVYAVGDKVYNFGKVKQLYSK